MNSPLDPKSAEALEKLRAFHRSQDIRLLIAVGVCFVALCILITVFLCVTK